MRWRRAVAVATACKRDGEIVRVSLRGANRGGLIAELAGLPGFIPYSQVDIPALEAALVGAGEWEGWADEPHKGGQRARGGGDEDDSHPPADSTPPAESSPPAGSSSPAEASAPADPPADPPAPRVRGEKVLRLVKAGPGGSAGRSFRLSPSDKAELVGVPIDVVTMAVNRQEDKLVLSMVRATQARALASIQLGALVWGTVRKVEAYGAFIGIDDTRESALLHVSNISRTRVPEVGTVLSLGDRVRAIVVGLDEASAGDGKARRISLSTAELEAEDGDMLEDPQAVFDGAEAQAAHFRAHVARLAAEAAAGGEGEKGGRGGWGGRGGRGGRDGGDDGGGGGGGRSREEDDDFDFDGPLAAGG